MRHSYTEVTKQGRRALAPAMLPPTLAAFVHVQLAKATVWPNYPHLNRERFELDLDALLATLLDDADRFRPVCIAAFEFGGAA
jgi:hypothetical protein